MASTVAVHRKGVGFAFQTCMNSWIACSKSATLRNAPRRTAFWLNSSNQRSTKLSQLELVGMKCRTKRGCLASQWRTRSWP